MQQNQLPNFGEIEIAPKRPVPIVLLLDTSGSMTGKKLNDLNDGYRELISQCKSHDPIEAEYVFTVITFGEKPKVHIDNKTLKEISPERFSGGGLTPLGEAMGLACKKLDEFYVKNKQAYRPIIALLSDGQPTDMPSGLGKSSPRTDFWKEWDALKQFHSHRRIKKAIKLACAYGDDAIKEMLVAFANADGTTSQKVLLETEAGGLRQFFRLVTASIGSSTCGSTDDEDWSEMGSDGEFYF